MLEMRRLAYLNALDVPVYIPRVGLPGAKPSVLCELPRGIQSETSVIFDAQNDSSIQDTVQNTAPTTKSQGSAQLAALQQELSGERKTSQINRNNQVNKVNDNAAVEGSTERGFEKDGYIDTVSDSQNSMVHYHLALFQPLPGMMIISPSQGMDNRHLRLLKNILRAIQQPVDMLAPIDHFIWPPKNLPAIMGSDQTAALETLGSLLDGYRKKHQINTLLVLDEEIGQLISNFDLQVVEVVVLPSLNAMLSKARFKQQAWQKLQKAFRLN